LIQSGLFFSVSGAAAKVASLMFWYFTGIGKYLTLYNASRFPPA